MLDIRNSKKALENLGYQKKVKIVQLMLKRWNELKEMVTILQIPYKATVKIQKRDLSLSDEYDYSFENTRNMPDEKNEFCQVSYRFIERSKKSALQ